MGARTVIAVDMDRDGDMDALAASVDDDTVAWHRNDGRGNFTKQIVDQSADGAYFAYGVDMNRDGRIDVLSASKVSNTIALLLQN